MKTFEERERDRHREAEEASVNTDILLVIFEAVTVMLQRVSRIERQLFPTVERFIIFSGELFMLTQQPLPALAPNSTLQLSAVPVDNQGNQDALPAGVTTNGGWELSGETDSTGTNISLTGLLSIGNEPAGTVVTVTVGALNADGTPFKNAAGNAPAGTATETVAAAQVASFVIQAAAQ